MGEAQSINPNAIALGDVIKLSRGTQEYQARLTNLNDLLSDNIEALFSNLQGDPESNVLLKAILDNIRDLISTQGSEIQYVHKLIGNLVTELQEQGISIESQELNEETQYAEL